MSFPNPVERHDLPVKKRIWPRVLIGLAVCLVLVVAFLPRILQTRVGRRLIRARLESRYNAEVSLQSFHTSWFGGTTAAQFWIKGADGRVVGFRSLQSDKLSLLKLLRGKYDLGNCAIDGLIVEYVFDDGNEGHRDTYELITGAMPRPPGAPPASLAKLSGNIQVTEAQLNLYRNRLDPDDLSSSLAQTHFTNVSANFQIPSLDRPWKFSAMGMVGLTASEHGSPFQASGQLCLGKGGVMSPADISVNAHAVASGVPTELAAVLCPLWDTQDCRGAFGDVFNHVDVAITGESGVIRVIVKDATGPRGHMNLSPKFDLRSEPTAVTVDAGNQAGNVITCALPRGSLGKQIIGVNPLLSGAEDASVILLISELDVPFLRTQWLFGSAKGTLQVQDVKWSRDANAAVSSDLVQQLGALTDAGDSARSLRCQPEPLELLNGLFTVSPTPMRWGEATVTLAGTCSVDGQLNMTAVIDSPKLSQILGSSKSPDFAGLALMINGTSANPRLDMDSTIRKLPPAIAAKLQDWMNNQTAAVHRREQEAAQREKDKQVQDLIKQFGPEHPTTSVTGN